MRFRDHLPDACPPEDAKSADGTVYRLVDKRNDKPSPNDFLSQHEIDPERWPADCHLCSLSVHADLEESRQLLEAIPYFYKNKRIAKGHLEPILGLMQATPRKEAKSHHDWWLNADEEPWRVFQLV